MPFLPSLWICSVFLLAACGPRNASDTKPAGSAESATTNALEAGAKLTQKAEPLKRMDAYLVGLYPIERPPNHQMEAHHFCRQVNEDFAQCPLFDGNTANANLNGIEYIISEKLVETLPPEERRYGCTLSSCLYN